MRVEGERKVINESEMFATPFSKRLITKSRTGEREVIIEGLLLYLKNNDAKQAFQLIKFIEVTNLLNSGDVCHLYNLYIKYLKVIEPRCIDNNISYLKG